MGTFEYNGRPYAGALYSEKVWVVAAPVILILGTFGNVMAILVLWRMRSSKSAFVVFFTALSVTDLLLLYVGVFPKWIEVQFVTSIIAYNDVTCKLFGWLFYSLGILSAWLIVAFTVQRAVSVVWHHRVHFTQKHTSLTIGVLIFVSFGVSSHMLYGIVALENDNEGRPQCWNAISNEYHYFQRYYWVWLELGLFSLLPFLIIIISNVILISRLVQSSRDARTTLGATNAQHVNIDRINATLIAVSIAFVMLTLPACIVSIWMAIAGSMDIYDQQLFWRTVSDILWATNSAINFYLYILTGAKFRRQFVNMFRKV